jgi:thioredoxin reductase/SAM-dependent methyltransferase
MHDEHHSGPPRTMERHCDVAIVGGSAAGLAAALQLGRQRRGVIVIDSGEPRNAPTAAMHGYLGHEAIAPRQLSSIGREEVRSYGVEVLDGRVVDVSGSRDRFDLELTGGHVVVARRLLAASGLVDKLPDIEGVAEHWGDGVVHCPFCHGYELRDRRVVALVTHAMGLHPAALWAQLTRSFTIVVHDHVDKDDPQLDLLRATGVQVLDGAARRLATGTDGRISGVELTDGRLLDAAAVTVVPGFTVRAEAFESLGLTTIGHPSGLGRVVEVDANGETSVPGLYAAGNVTDPSQQVLHAAANGSRVGAMISFSLAHEDLVADLRRTANETDWDHRYDSEPMWSGNPNGTLVDEVDGLVPGRALDVGAGEGGDAIWLAEHGWTVTASDVSQRALDRVGAEAARRGLDVECLRVDANGLEPFDSRSFELVSAQYASIPRTPDGRGVDNLLAAVAPGGTLIVVGHDLEPIRTAVDTTDQSRPFDPDAYVRVDDVAAGLDGSPDWVVELHQTRPRPAGAVSTHHVDDIVLRARRC